MKKMLAIVAMVLLPSASAVAGDGYDRCVREEKALRAEVVDSCSGLRYLFNPSGCFAARKKLDAYKCTAKGVIPLPPAATPAGKGGGTAETSEKRKETAPPPQENDIERLKAENARLNAEIFRLKEEIDRLKNCPAQ